MTWCIMQSLLPLLVPQAASVGRGGKGGVAPRSSQRKWHTLTLTRLSYLLMNRNFYPLPVTPSPTSSPSPILLPTFSVTLSPPFLLYPHPFLVSFSSTCSASLLFTLLSPLPFLHSPLFLTLTTLLLPSYTSYPHLLLLFFPLPPLPSLFPVPRLPPTFISCSPSLLPLLLPSHVMDLQETRTLGIYEPIDVSQTGGRVDGWGDWGEG